MFPCSRVVEGGKREMEGEKWKERKVEGNVERKREGE